MAAPRSSFGSWYPVVTTSEVVACRRFYVDTFDAEVVFDGHWYLQLRIDNALIGFVHPSPPVRLPVFQQLRPTRGLNLVVEVNDVDVEYARLKALNVELLGRPERYADGQPAFQVIDPAGVVLNLVQAETRRPLDITLE